jgi:hypothetical protein
VVQSQLERIALVRYRAGCDSRVGEHALLRGQYDVRIICQARLQQQPHVERMVTIGAKFQNQHTFRCSATHDLRAILPVEDAPWARAAGTTLK